MKKFFLLFFAVLFSFYISFAQNSLRDVVGIIRPVYSENTERFLSEFSQTLREQGFYFASEKADPDLSGIYITGIVFEDSGRFYMLTGRTPLIQADYVDIEIKGLDGNNRSFNKCNVIALHEELDLAIVEFPENTKFESAFKFSLIDLEDGMDVYSAGYPLLSKEPSWQLGQGIISNKEFFSDKMTNGNPTHIIQHTAQIDIGSAGSPLLIRNENSPLEYDVIGINMWKVRERENANFAIPSSEIVKFVDSALNSGIVLSEELFKKTVEEFIELSKIDYKSVTPYISVDFVHKLPYNNFLELQKNSSQKAKIGIADNFRRAIPVEAIRIALADEICKQFASKSVSLISIENYNTSGEPVKVMLKKDNETISSYWVLEKNKWKISEISSINLTPLPLKKDEYKPKYDFNHTIHAGISTYPGINFSYYLTFVGFMSLGADINMQRMPLYKLTHNSGCVFYGEKIGKLSFGWNIYYGFQAPIRISRLNFVPFFKGNVGVNYFPDEKISSISHYGFYTGMDVIFKYNKNKKRRNVITGIGFSKRYYDGGGAIYMINDNLSKIDLHLGLVF